ncbi:glycosyltransferase family 4 protein [Ornithinimicrobium cryptoxanthini]|uniref:Glycosyltransferase family 4 protein n=1 Tax=Ornithinimicrobium cryptoxanthini TaxID=2934161 RepID=A0ABY4YLL7_9MICO|nr:glycosyltransferase family 4 protein [Ornithinimicrobium cryptoxanthini]USQ77680.1 glycosyltransferase family 4 protein [Ornithinimicrobium cryptoxanthini]
MTNQITAADETGPIPQAPPVPQAPHVPDGDLVELPAVDGRAPRVALLVYRDADTDSRVLKSAATLRDAGADVLIVGSARDRSGFPAGHATSPDGLAIYRAPDLDLVRSFSTAARVWRRLRGRDPQTGAVLTQPTRTQPTRIQPTAEDQPAPRHTTDAVVPQSLPGRAKALAADAYMRTYQVGRLSYYWLGAVREARRFAPDVVHANDGNTLAPAMLLKVLDGARIVYDSHELWLRRNVRQDRWFAPAVEALTERVGVAVSDGIITVSPSIVRWLQDTYRLRVAPTLVRNIPLREGAPPDPADGRLRELTGLGRDDRIVSYVGGITTGRGLEETVEALTLLPDHVHLVLLGFGGPEYVEGLVALAEQRGVGDRMHLAGQVPGPQVPQTLADADVAVVFVRPIVLSYLYSLPNKLFESIHAGLPIVAADLPDTAAVVREHGVGEVFDARTPAELAEAIRDVLADPAAFRAASRRAAERLDWRFEAHELTDLYARVLRGARRGR